MGIRYWILPVVAHKSSLDVCYSIAILYGLCYQLHFDRYEFQSAGWKQVLAIALLWFDRRRQVSQAWEKRRLLRSALLTV